MPAAADPLPTGLPEAPRPPRVQVHALENLRFIRETMERAASFTAVPGWGAVAIGTTATFASLLAARQGTPGGWIAVWLAEAAVAAAIGLVATGAKARREGVSLLSGAGGRFLLALVPPMAAGAALTIAMLRAGATALLPGTWLLLYGLGLVAGSVFSLPVFRGMGAAFASLGTVALFVPSGGANLLMAAGFGGLHVLFGIRIARRHGG